MNTERRAQIIEYNKRQAANDYKIIKYETALKSLGFDLKTKTKTIEQQTTEIKSKLK